jgi:hypothetical protein
VFKLLKHASLPSKLIKSQTKEPEGSRALIPKMVIRYDSEQVLSRLHPQNPLQR